MKPSPADFDTRPADDAPIDATEQAAALVKVFFAIVREWQVDTEGSRRLLGNMSRSRLFELKNAQPRALRGLSEDELDRLAYLAGIYADLNVLFTPDNALRWLTNTARAVDGVTRPWGDTAPLGYLLSGKMAALVDVYRYVQGLRHG